MKNVVLFEKIVNDIFQILQVKQNLNINKEYLERKSSLCSNVLFLYRIVAAQPNCTLSNQTWY